MSRMRMSLKTCTLGSTSQQQSHDRYRKKIITDSSNSQVTSGCHFYQHKCCGENLKLVGLIFPTFPP
uniref:Uncharacterized protein n=1 Tax=Arundo donax TaxID=35708 RepID=A0A0A9FR49_ARUDO